MIFNRHTLAQKSFSAVWFLRLSWDELLYLLLCIGIDLIDYIFPIFMTPLVGDVFDLTGVVFSVLFIGKLGFLTLPELIPGLDVLPVFSTTWLIWYSRKRRKTLKRTAEELDKWR